MDISFLVTEIKKQFLTNQFFSATVLGGGMMGILVYLRHVPGRIYSFILNRTTVTVRFTSMDPMFPYLHKWVSTNTRFDRFQKNYNASSRKQKISAMDYSNHLVANGSNLLKEAAVIGSDDSEMERPMFLMTPQAGEYFIHYKNKWMKMKCEREEPNKSGGSNSSSTIMNAFIYEAITITYIGRNTAYIKNLMNDIIDMFCVETKRQINVMMPSRNGSYWNEHTRIVPRKIESIISRDDSLDTLIADLTHFKDKQTEEWYVDKGVPYHRGYLLEGPPGTGKTSMIYAIASHFNMDVYYLNVTDSIKDEDFLSLVGEVGKNSILLLEDIDCIFDEKRNKKNDVKINFSTMLNALDGFCSKHGNIVFITTNHPEKLDPALVRKGRIDMTIDFKLCNLEQIRKFFLKFFPDIGPERAIEFASHFHDDVFSPAEIQTYLMTSKTPEASFDNLDAFLKTKETQPKEAA